MRLLDHVREQFDPADPTQRRLRMDQLILNARNSIHSTATYPFAVLLIGLAAMQWAEPVHVAIWMLAVLILV
jgi:hypothetical protein